MNEPLFVDFSQSGRPSASCSDSGDDRRAVFVTAAACGHELHVDDADRQTADMVGLDRIRQLKQLALGGLGCCERAIVPCFHVGGMISVSIASAGRFSPFGLF
jgi:hypothetical protein